MSLLEDFDAVASPQKNSDSVSLLEKFDAAAQPDTTPKTVKPVEPLTWGERIMSSIPNIADWQNWNVRGSKLGSVAMGAADMGAGAVQLGAHALSAATGVDTTTVDKRMADVEQQYQSSRPDQNTDWLRIGGNFAEGAMLPVGKTVEEANLVNRMIAAAKIGTGIGLAQPVSDTANYWVEKAKQGGLGMIGGLVAQPIAEGAAKVLGTAADTAINYARPIMKSISGGTDDAMAPVANSSPELQAAVKDAINKGGRSTPKL